MPRHTLAVSIAAGLAAASCLAGSNDTYTFVHSGQIVYDATLDGSVSADSSGGSFYVSVSIDPAAVDQDPAPDIGAYAATVNSAVFTLPADLGGAVIEIPAGTGVTLEFFSYGGYDGVVASLSIEGGSFPSGPVLDASALSSEDRPSRDIYLTSDFDPAATRWTDFSPPPITNGYEWATQTTDATFFTPMRDHDILATAFRYPDGPFNDIWRIRMTADGQVDSIVPYHRAAASSPGNFEGDLSWDPCRGSVVVSRNRDLIFIDEPGIQERLLNLPSAGEYSIARKRASMHGLIYLQDGYELYYLDENDQRHPLLDLDGNLAVVAEPPVPAPPLSLAPWWSALPREDQHSLRGA